MLGGSRRRLDFRLRFANAELNPLCHLLLDHPTDGGGCTALIAFQRRSGDSIEAFGDTDRGQLTAFDQSTHGVVTGRQALCRFLDVEIATGQSSNLSDAINALTASITQTTHKSSQPDPAGLGADHFFLARGSTSTTGGVTSQRNFTRNLAKKSARPSRTNGSPEPGCATLTSSQITHSRYFTRAASKRVSNFPPAPTPMLEPLRVAKSILQSLMNSKGTIVESAPESMTAGRV